MHNSSVITEDTFPLVLESFQLVCLPCIVLVLHILTKLFADMTSWSVDHVLEFAKHVGLDEEDLAVLKKEKYIGTALLKVTEEKLRADGMPRGQAINLLAARDEYLKCMLLRFTPHVVPHYTDLVLFVCSQPNLNQKVSSLDLHICLQRD